VARLLVVKHESGRRTRYCSCRERGEKIGEGDGCQCGGNGPPHWHGGRWDLTFMLLLRLRGLVHRAWSPANSASSPIAVTASQHPEELWTQFSLASFRASTVNWL
jgi:hypothetical protein